MSPAVSLKWEMALAALSGLGALVLKALIMLIICKIAMNIIMRLVDKLFEKLNMDAGIKSFARSSLHIALWFITIIIVGETVGIQMSSLVAVLSVASLALSLSVQNILTNVFSGLTILMSRPFKVGDMVEMATVSGKVSNITIMRTTLLTPDNKEILIPNSDITTSKIINYSSEEQRRVDMTFSASYDDSTETVKAAIMEAIRADERILTDPAPFIGLQSYNASDITYVVRVWCLGPDYWDVHFALNEKVRETFASHGVEFAYPHTIVHIEH